MKIKFDPNQQYQIDVKQGGHTFDKTNEVWPS